MLAYVESENQHSPHGWPTLSYQVCSSVVTLGGSLKGPHDRGREVEGQEGGRERGERQREQKRKLQLKIGSK